MVKLNGAWETKGYLGPRIEIRGRKLIRLWRGSPVLETTFTKEKEEAPATTKICPRCKSEINIEATRCPHCTSEL